MSATARLSPPPTHLPPSLSPGLPECKLKGRRMMTRTFTFGSAFIVGSRTDGEAQLLRIGLRRRDIIIWVTSFLLRWKTPSAEKT